jgi:hypothetical protein
MEEPYRCPGCQQPELHKMCPAHGTPFYMSGRKYPPDNRHEINMDGEMHGPEGVGCNFMCGDICGICKVGELHFQAIYAGYYYQCDYCERTSLRTHYDQG